MLQPLESLNIKQSFIPTKTCEICGTIKEVSLMFNIMVVVGVAGHAMIKPFQCPAEEHWACSIDHWERVAHACVTEHGKELLIAAHKEINNVSNTN